MLGRHHAWLLIFSTAAAVAFFSLERKETKVQGKGHASSRPAGSSRFSRCILGCALKYITRKAKPAFPPYTRPAPFAGAGAFLLLQESHEYSTVLPVAAYSRQSRVAADRSCQAFRLYCARH